MVNGARGTAWTVGIFALWALIAVVFFFALGFLISSTVGQDKGPPEPPLPEPPKMQAGLKLVYGPADQTVAKNNRLWLEAQNGVIQLNAGIIDIDQGLKLKSGVTLLGAGMYATQLRNRYTFSPFMLNCTIWCYGDAPDIGYADTIKLIGPNVISFEDAAAVKNYNRYSICWTWKWDAYTTEGVGTTHCRRHRIESVKDNVIALSSPPDPVADRAVWALDPLPLTAAQEGSAIVTSSQNILTTSSPNWKVGSWVRIVDGVPFADEVTGENRRIKAINMRDNQFMLDRPLRQSYGVTSNNAGICLIHPSTNVTIRDIGFAPSPQPQVGNCCAFFVGAIGWTVERCLFEGATAIGHASDSVFRDCRINGQFGVNSCQDILMERCRVTDIAIEENSFDCEFRDCQVVTASSPVSVLVNDWAPCKRLNFRRLSIEGTIGMPIISSAEESKFYDISIRGSNIPPGNYSAAYLSGNGLQVDGFDSDLHTRILKGQDVRLVRMNGMVFLDAGQPQGKAMMCQRLDVGALNPQTKGTWTFIATPTVNAVTGPDDRKPLPIMGRKTRTR